MTDSLWNRAVAVKMGGGTVFHIRTSREAVWCLLDSWPEEKFASYRNALRACTNALDGKESDSVARFLLVIAAQEAGLEVTISSDIREPDRALADLTEEAFRNLFGV